MLLDCNVASITSASNLLLITSPTPTTMDAKYHQALTQIIDNWVFLTCQILIMCIKKILLREIKFNLIKFPSQKKKLIFHYRLGDIFDFTKDDA